MERALQDLSDELTLFQEARMTLSLKELSALHNLADKQSGQDVDWINIADARALTELGLARPHAPRGSTRGLYRRTQSCSRSEQSQVMN